ncbi:MAG: AAA family ATPase [bacterium]
MNPLQLKETLTRICHNDLKMSVMIWGPPGVGKSSIVSQVAEQDSREVIDVRLSQLAPTDLRGLPVAQGQRSSWLPPEFLPESGRGILFLDEINMAPPALQGVAQQLILDRKVGSYRLPEGWLVWSAGNRKEDRASVFEMPAPLANRYLHFEVEPDFPSFKQHAIEAGLHEHLLAFLNFRPSLLHQPGDDQSAWPSPRTWMMADQLHRCGLSIKPAVGAGPEHEFSSYLEVYQNLPDFSEILEGETKGLSFPDQPAARYAVTLGLAAQVRTAEHLSRAFHWLLKKAGAEWVQLFIGDAIARLRKQGGLAILTGLIKEDPEFQRFTDRLRTALA